MPLALAGLGVMVLACTGGAGTATSISNGPAISLVTTLYPLEYFAGRIGAQRVSVENLVSPGVEAHSFDPTPADIRKLDAADVILYNGFGFEPWIDRALTAIGEKDRTVIRVGQEGGAMDGGQVGDEPDPHVWLDPRNAAAIVRFMVIVMANADPANAVLYRRNGADLLARLGTLEAALRQSLEPVAGVSYLTFHDAFGYFEDRFGLASAGAVAVTPERPPGAKRISALRRRIKAGNTACVFTEPEFEPALAGTLIEGTKARIGILDPLGAGLKPGPGLYGELMRGLAESLKECLKP